MISLSQFMIVSILMLNSFIYVVLSIECGYNNETNKTSITLRNKISSILDEQWVATAIQDIAYFIRSFKFNAVDPRYIQEYNSPTMNDKGFYKAFPVPSLRPIHWNVFKNCENDFVKCVTYLHSIIKSAPLTRNDDTVYILNRNSIPLKVDEVNNIDNQCKKAFNAFKMTSSPFDGALEKFQWLTSASYFMCWYTMIETPSLSMLGEPCDNFASCLDPIFGLHNKDPRADDKYPFSCAMYSFCPDVCCQYKHIVSMEDCYNKDSNPCYGENIEDNLCELDRKDNKNLEDIIENRWNVSCKCQEIGFVWKSQFGMCVDLNECLEERIVCDSFTEDCLNLPGTYTCICKWGYRFDKKLNRCI